MNSGIFTGGVLLCTVCSACWWVTPCRVLQWRGRGTLRLVLLVQVVPFQLLMVPLYVLIARNYGLADNYLGMILPFAINSTAVFIFRQYFLQLPAELFEAARIDGAGELRPVAIALPLVRPALLTVVLLTFIGPWNEFLWPFLITKDAACSRSPSPWRTTSHRRGPGHEPVRRHPRRRRRAGRARRWPVLVFQRHFIAPISDRGSRDDVFRHRRSDSVWSAPAGSPVPRRRGRRPAGVGVRAVADPTGEAAPGWPRRTAPGSRLAGPARRRPASTSSPWSTPPRRTPTSPSAALTAGRHVLCEKPLATDRRRRPDGRGRRGRLRSGALVVDHVLRYNPLLRRWSPCRTSCSGRCSASRSRTTPATRTCRRPLVLGRGGTAAASSSSTACTSSTPRTCCSAPRPSVPATAAARARTARPTWSSATAAPRRRARHPHPRLQPRAPVRAPAGGSTTAPPRSASRAGSRCGPGRRLDRRRRRRARRGAARPGRRRCSTCRAHRLGAGAGITVVVHRDAGPPAARGRGRDLDVPHRVGLHLVLGGDGAKQRVYAESVRAAIADLVVAARTGGRPPLRHRHRCRRHHRSPWPPPARPSSQQTVHLSGDPS